MLGEISLGSEGGNKVVEVGECVGEALAGGHSSSLQSKHLECGFGLDVHWLNCITEHKGSKDAKV